MTSININSMFETASKAISKKGEALQNQITDLQTQEEISTDDMLKLQFSMGQYNSLIESISTVTKSITDTMKSLAQRAN